MKANLLTSLLLLLACANAPATPSSPTTVAVADKPAVTLTDSDGSSVRVSVEVADDAEERQVGLMNRPQLDEMTGMWFIFPNEAKQSFWMKNTLIPLDMIFVRSDMTIAGIVENAEPLTLVGRGVAEPTQYVLEVNGGFCERHKIKAGSHVRFTDGKR